MKRRFRGWMIFLVLAVIAAAWLGMNVINVVPQVRLLHEFGLSASMIFDIEDYAYWNDFLKYTDGYEIMVVGVDSDEWETPEIWNAGETTLFEVLLPYGLGFSSALSDEMESGKFPAIFQEWFVAEKRPGEDYDQWEFFVGGYDGDQTLFLYRGHHLYGDADLRLTGE